MYMYPASNVMFTLQGDDGCSELLVDFKYDDSVPMRKRKPNWITCLASVASKRILFAGDVNGQVSRISIADFALLETRKLHSACVTCMSCSTKNLFTASDDGTLKVWTFDLNQVSFDELILLTTVRYYNFMYMYMLLICSGWSVLPRRTCQACDCERRQRRVESRGVRRPTRKRLLPQLD